MAVPETIIADVFKQDEGFTSWLDYLDEIGSPPEPVSLPAGPAMERVLRYLEIPEDDIPDVIRTTPSPDTTPELWWMLERVVNSLLLHMGKVERPPRFGELRDDNDPRFRFFYVHAFIATLPFTKAYFRERGIPMDVQQAALADLGRNVRVHRKRNDQGGLGVMWWLMLHFRGMIYQFGRLQFERAHLGEKAAESARAMGIDAHADSHVLSIHIPDFLGPMTPQACDDSIRQARSFFETYFPDEQVLAGVCHSWLLDPQLKEYLRPESNIIQFQDRFTIVPGSVDSTTSIQRFVFGKLRDNLDDYPQRSSLERAVVTHLRNGGTWDGRYGWFPW